MARIDYFKIKRKHLVSLSDLYDEINLFQDSMAIVKKDGLFGFINRDLKLIIPCIYEEVSKFRDNLSIVKKNGLYGVIDRNNQQIIPCSYQKIIPCSKELFFVFFNNTWKIITLDNKLLNSLEYDNITCLNQGYYLATDKKNQFLIHETGSVFSVNSQDKIFPFQNNLAVVLRNNLYGYVDLNMNLKIPFSLNEAYPSSCDLVVGKKNGKWQIKNKLNEKVSLSYYYEYIFPYRENLARVKRDGKYTFIDKNGKEIMPLIYDYLDDFHYGKALFRLGRKYGFITKKNLVETITNYSYISNFKENIAICKIKDREGIEKSGLINDQNQVILNFNYDFIIDFNEEDDLIRVVKDKKYGLVDKKGKTIVPCIYDFIDRVYKKENIIKVIKDNQKFYINRKGKKVLTTKEEIFYTDNIKQFDNIEILEYLTAFNLDEKTVIVSDTNYKIYREKVNSVQRIIDQESEENLLNHFEKEKTKVK